MKSFIFGSSSLGLPQHAYTFEGSKPKKNILILGGVHGDEIEGVVLCQALIQKLLKNPIEEANITIVPEFNIEGVLLKTRQNYKGVDLNRNLPTKDWSPEYRKIRYFPGDGPASEKENQALVNYLESNKVDFLISIHSWKPMLNTNGDCSPIAEHISKSVDYIIKDDIGYPTPGSLGTYTGHERQIPTLTYEIQKGIDMEEILNVHLEPLFESLKLYTKD